MPYFKRENETLNEVKRIAEQLPETEKKTILELVRLYEISTFEEWGDKPKFTADAIDTFVNDFGFADDLVAKTMANNHPTLQQSFMRLCLKFIRLMSEKKYFDDRNKASVQTAQKIMESIEGNIGLPCI